MWLHWPLMSIQRIPAQSGGTFRGRCHGLLAGLAHQTHLARRTYTYTCQPHLHVDLPNAPTRGPAYRTYTKTCSLQIHMNLSTVPILGPSHCTYTLIYPPHLHTNLPNAPTHGPPHRTYTWTRLLHLHMDLPTAWTCLESPRFH